MGSLSNVEANLPPGFRFFPRDEELICDYLMKWVSGVRHQFPMLIEVELNKCEPWEIPETACVGGKEWYFYCLRDRKYATGVRTNRATVSGYWKATGKDRPISRKGIHVGMRKTLVFYQGRAPKGRKTDWVMHEFRLEGPLSLTPTESTPKEEDWVLCRVFSKRSVVSGKHSTANTATVDDIPPPLPPLSTDPFAGFAGEYNEQVPCFSIVTPAPQGNTGFSILQDHLDFGIYASVLSDGDPSHCDRTAIKAVLNRFAKRESCFDQCGVYESGEGSSADSYLSEADLSSMWN